MREPSYLLPRLSVDRPVTVVMVLVALLVVGYIAYTRIPISLFPEGMEGDGLGVWVSYPNASPVEVEEKIARPVEEMVGTISRVKEIRSWSSPRGCWTRIDFRPNTDMKQAYAELADRMDRVMPELPDDIERIWLRKWDQNDIPIMWMGATLQGDFGDPFFLLDTYLRPVLQRVEGVGNVEIWGSADKQVQIELNQEKVRRHGADVYQLVGQLRRHNFTLSGGYVREGGRKIFVRSVGKFRTIQEIRDFPIDPEHNLKLGDIAAVSIKRPKQDWVNRIDRKPSLGIEIKRASGGNIAQISRKVRAALEEARQTPQLQGIDFEVFWDQGEHVQESVDNLKTTGKWGGLLAAMVLFFFLRAVRMTLIITLAIPLSLLATVVLLYFAGWSLNIGTMMGLMLSLGLVVDNAIVIVENIYRKRQGGMEPRQASIEGAGEVGLAITMATLTTVVVFLPLILMSDDQFLSFWMLRIGIPVVIGLLASLFIALAIIPLAAQRLSTGKERSELNFILRLREVYIRCLEWVLDHRVDALIVVLLAMASIQIPMSAMKRADQEEGHQNNLWLVFDLPSGQSLEKVDRFMSSVEDTLMNHREDYNIRTLETRFRSGWARVQLIFREDERDEWYQVAYDDFLITLGIRQASHLGYKEMVEDIKERLVPPPGVKMRINWQGGDQDTAVSINLYGEDTRVLVELAEEAERRLRRIPGLVSVYTDMERGGSELQVRLDRDQARRYGIDPRMVSGNIAYTLRGIELSKFQTEEGREITIKIQLEEGDLQTMQQLRGLTFPTAEGREVPLESLASLFVTRTLGEIRRENRQTMLGVTATAGEEDAEALFEQVDRAMQGFEMPRGYRWDKGARYVRLEESDESQKFAIAMSIIFVFLLMGMLFESFVLPLSVIVAIPFSFLGVYWILYLTDTTYEVMSMVGTVILIGVVVNNAIVLIDLTNRLREEGRSRRDALVEAGRHRFRPILMTTFTTICGLLPMAVGNARMVGMPYAPLGRTMMGGLLASTVLTLVIVPLCYTLFDDLRVLLQRIAASAFARNAAPAGEEAGGS